MARQSARMPRDAPPGILYNARFRALPAGRSLESTTTLSTERPILPSATSEFVWVDTPDGLARVASAVRTASRVALDTEADSLHHYFEKVCLMQITAGRTNFLIDPLAGLDLAPLLDALTHHTLVLHGGDYDLRMLRASTGFDFQGTLIDTMIASQLLGYDRVGLESLLERFGVLMGATHQKSDWSHRPLTDDQLRYAIDDTRFLEPLADRLLAELDRLGRIEWFKESCQALVAATKIDRPADPDREWRIRGVGDLTARQAAFVRELWYWRDREARRLDRPAFKVLGNDKLVELALWADTHPDAPLEDGPRLPRNFHPRRLASLQKALRRAAALKPSECPPPRLRGQGRREQPGPALDALRAAVAALAGQLGIDPPVLAPRAAMETVSRLEPTTAAEIEDNTGLLHWQANLLAPLVRRVLTGGPDEAPADTANGETG